ncbi:MAG: NAD(+)/NADH kinase [Chloroflexi bacterium]|nr:NAD(+)/NADH kinase [Chloroflexota bacterium]MCL5076012.1 NAD(+)/NADH kinase [Chloroflexota bacterium]
MQSVAVIYNRQLAVAVGLARDLYQSIVGVVSQAWLGTAEDEVTIRSQAGGLDLAVVLGGDGTIVRIAKWVAPYGVSILGINCGQLGLLSELTVEETMGKVPLFLKGDYWLEERLMLQAKVSRCADAAEPSTAVSAPEESYLALNDIAVGRIGAWRVVRVRTTINDELWTTYKADGVIVSTPTGTTAYSLAAGGPILHPESKNLVLIPICPHLTWSVPLVLPAEVRIGLQVFTSYEAAMSVDGQIDVPLRNGDKVEVTVAPVVSRFARRKPPDYFYQAIAEKLR